jgi:hypothetical protein
VIGFVIGVAFAPVAAMLAVQSGGAGHGCYEFAGLFFPYTMLLTRLTGDTITLPLIALALAQFPMYGAAIGMCARRRWVAIRVSWVLLIAHAVAVVFCFSGLIPNFS